MLSAGIFYGGGALVLGGVMAYGMYRNSTRNKANDKITEAATRMQYKDPERYEHGGREELKKELKE